MPIPLVHIIGTHPGCGATTLTHLWGESADERPLDSPLPAKGSPWVVPVLMGSYQLLNNNGGTLRYLAGIPHLRFGGILIRPESSESALDLDESVAWLRDITGTAPIHWLNYHEDLAGPDSSGLPQWDFCRPTPKRVRRDPWFRTFSQFADITDYIVRTERSTPS